MLHSDLVNRDIGILGGGREGIAAWRWLRDRFPAKPLTVYEEGDIDSSLGELLGSPLDHLVTGPFELEKLSTHDLLIRSPGVSPYRDDLSILRNNGMQFSSASSLWFANHEHVNTICITGTKGKSTTAALTDHLLQKAGCRTCLAGNIGRPLLECETAGVDWWVIELSSYQLADLEAAPSIVAITNLSDEHLDWHGSTAVYRRDKLRLATLAGEAPVIVNRSDDFLASKFAGMANAIWFEDTAGFHVHDNVLWQGERRIEGIPRGSLPGSHNLSNLAAAMTTIGQAGFEFPDLAQALGDFAGLPHRLQRLGVRHGISYVNDSLSTTPVSVVAALEALRDERVILLAGGMDRGLDWRPLVPHMKELAPVAVICLPDNGPEIALAMKEQGLDPAGGIQFAPGLEGAMDMAMQMADAGDTVLLSPGAPSFPRFRDYADRGRQFAQLAGFLPE
jgi:UDP-N-acetylmuramoylalanine--D-glutamate ligase